MELQNLFEVALNINSPWYIKTVSFSQENSRIDIYIDFKKGSITILNQEMRIWHLL